MAPSGRGAAAGCRVILLVRDVQTPRTVFVYQKEAETDVLQNSVLHTQKSNN